MTDTQKELHAGTFHIAFWKSIPLEFIRKEDGQGGYVYSEERIREAAESGMTVLDCQYDDREVRLHYPKEEQEAAAKISNNEEEINRAIMKVCEKYGLRCNISDTRIWRAFNGSENWRDEIREMADAYRGYPALFSFHIKDEPATRDEFDRIARVKHYLEELNPDVEGYVNLLPGNGEKYEADLEYFIEAVRPSILSYDRYHFGQKRIELSSLSQIDMQSNRYVIRSDGVYEKFDGDGYIDNLETFRRMSLKYGIPFMTTLQLTQHAHYRDLTEGEIRYEVFTALAYGVSRLSYYTYWTYHTINFLYTNGMIERDGSKTHYYYIVREINKEVSMIGAYTGNSLSTGVYHIGYEKDAVTYWPDGGTETVRHIDAKRLIAGFFENGMFMLVNKDYNDFQHVTFSLVNDGKLLRLDKKTGMWEDMYSFNGMYHVRFAPGDGELFRVII